MARRARALALAEYHRLDAAGAATGLREELPGEDDPEVYLQREQEQGAAQMAQAQKLRREALTPGAAQFVQEGMYVSSYSTDKWVLDPQYDAVMEDYYHSASPEWRLAYVRLYVRKYSSLSCTEEELSARKLP